MRPPDRAPKGKVWDTKTGEWKDEPVESASGDTQSVTEPSDTQSVTEPGDTQFVTEPKSGSGDFADVAMDVTEPGDTQSVTEPEPESDKDEPDKDEPDKDEPDKDEPAVSYAYPLGVTLTINYA